MPYVTNSIAIGMVFAAMFNMVGTNFNSSDPFIDTAGIMNNILGIFGVKPINWINTGSSYAANITVMVIYIVWNALPFKILILLGGLQSVNKQYYDAAKVDGTRRVRVFTRITGPLLSPMLADVVIRDQLRPMLSTNDKVTATIDTWRSKVTNLLTTINTSMNAV